jgi:MFS family permease
VVAKSRAINVIRGPLRASRRANAGTIDLRPAIPAIALILYLVVLSTILLHIAFAGFRVNLSLFALSLGASQFTVGIIVSLLALLPMMFAVGAGRIIDRTGIRKPMLLGACSVIAGIGLVFVSPRLETLFIASPLAGSGFMLYHIAVNHATGTLGPPEDRVRNFSLLALTFSTSGFLGPMLTGFSIDGIGLATPFCCSRAALSYPSSYSSPVVWKYRAARMKNPPASSGVWSIYCAAAPCGACSSSAARCRWHGTCSLL